MAASKGLFKQKTLTEFAYYLSRFNQYGLMRHDLLKDTPEVAEALRRLPKDLQDERNFRIVRAAYLEASKKVLPKEQWLKYEDDDLYLKPYLDEVYKEKKEREDWDNS